MSCDLSAMFDAIASTLPETGNEFFSFRPGVLAAPPATVHTDRIVIEKSHHNYDGLLRRDRLVFYAEKSAYCNFALLLASALFAPAPRAVALHLDHPVSGIRQLVVRRECPRDDAPGYHTMPFVLNYFPEPVERHPWAYQRVNPHMLPAFFLTNAQECVVSEADWKNRDVVIGFGRDEGAARLLELLLNMSRAASIVDEVALEGEEGFRGVAPLSCEATFLLPGGFGWDDTLWPEASTPSISSTL